MNDTIEREGGIHTEFPHCPLPQPVAQHAEPTVSSKAFVLSVVLLGMDGQNQWLPSLFDNFMQVPGNTGLPLGANSAIAGFTG